MSSPAGRPPLRRRLHDLVTQSVVRPLLFVLWSLVIWGTLVGLAFVYAALTRGPAAVVRAVLPPSTGGIWGGLNLALAVGAVAVWIVVAIAVLRRRRG